MTLFVCGCFQKNGKKKAHCRQEELMVCGFAFVCVLLGALFAGGLLLPATTPDYSTVNENRLLESTVSAPTCEKEPEEHYCGCGVDAPDLQYCGTEAVTCCGSSCCEIDEGECCGNICGPCRTPSVMELMDNLVESGSDMREMERRYPNMDAFAETLTTYSPSTLVKASARGWGEDALVITAVRDGWVNIPVGSIYTTDSDSQNVMTTTAVNNVVSAGDTIYVTTNSMDKYTEKSYGTAKEAGLAFTDDAVHRMSQSEFWIFMSKFKSTQKFYEM